MSIRRFSIRFSAVLAALALFSVAPTQAATITWSPAMTISGDTDVATTGSLVSAFAFSASGAISPTVNGVTFTGFAAPGVPVITHGNLTLAASSGATVNGHDMIFGSGNAPFASLSGMYQMLLASDANTTAGTPSPLVGVISGLTVGQKYLVEVWVNDSRGLTRSELLSDGGPTLSFDTTSADGGVGQFATGMFTADSTAQQFFVLQTPGSVVSQLNAFQLRSLPSSVPEPSTAVLCGLAGLVGAAYARWRRPRTA
jgi:hypothetical protein